MEMERLKELAERERVEVSQKQSSLLLWLCDS